MTPYFFGRFLADSEMNDGSDDVMVVSRCNLLMQSFILM